MPLSESVRTNNVITTRISVALIVARDLVDALKYFRGAL